MLLGSLLILTTCVAPVFQVPTCNDKNIYYTVYTKYRGQNSIVGKVTCWGLDSLGVESWWGQDFLHPPPWPWGPPSFPYNAYRVIPRVKQPGHGVDHVPPSSAKVKETVELYLYSLSGPSCLILG